MIALLLILILLVPAHTTWAAGVAVVQSTAPTTNGGTQDFTSPGFGTPVCALFFASYGTANGTVVDHAMMAIGFSDFTNERALAAGQEDSAGTTDTGQGTSSHALRTILNTDQTVDGTSLATTITDGVRLTWADAPPSGYLVTAVMFSAQTVSNCRVGSLIPSTTIGGTASASGFGWQPDLVMGLSRNNANANTRWSIGMALNDSGIVQFATGQNSQNGVTTSDVHSVMRNDRLVLNPLSTGGSSMDVTSFDSGGFTVTTRDDVSANEILYLAMKLATGISAKLSTCTSPTVTGAHSCTGTGWRPEAGILLQSIVPSLGVYHSTSADNETIGISAGTTVGWFTSSVTDDDGTGTANTASMTDSKPVRLMKDGADYMTATFTGFQADGADYDYTVVNGTPRFRIALFFEETASAVRPRSEVRY